MYAIAIYWLFHKSYFVNQKVKTELFPDKFNREGKKSYLTDEFFDESKKIIIEIR